MTDAPELLPCPFCGCDAELFGGPMAQETYSVWCRNQRGKRHNLECGTMDETQAVSEWNARVDLLADSEAKVKRLREALTRIRDANYRDCPFDGPAEHQPEPHEPCAVCGDYGDDRAFSQPSHCGSHTASAVARAALAETEDSHDQN